MRYKQVLIKRARDSNLNRKRFRKIAKTDASRAKKVMPSMQDGPVWSVKKYQKPSQRPETDNELKQIRISMTPESGVAAENNK